MTRLATTVAAGLLLASCSPSFGTRPWPDGVDTGRDSASDSSTEDTGPGDTADTEDTDRPQPESLVPCDNASCWDTEAPAIGCTTARVREDFSTGKYNVHAWTTRLVADRPATLGLAVTGGDWSPVLVVTDDSGTVLSDGRIGAWEPGREVEVVKDGAGGGPVELTLWSDQALDLVIYVTGWHVVDGDFSPDMPTDATYELTLDGECDDQEGWAPDGAMSGEVAGDAGTFTLSVGSGSYGAPVRIDAWPEEHIGFRMDFSPSDGDVDMEVLAWDGADAVSLGVTNAGSGLRVLAARDPDAGRTFWVRAEGSVGSGTLTITRTPLSDHPPCTAACGDLLQLPLPIDPWSQGYDMPSGVIYRYQFGRRDLLEVVFHVGREMAELGADPFTLKDMSQWDGSRPPNHDTHNDGYHSDLSLYTASGDAVWTGLCTHNDVRCTGGARDFGAEQMARYVGAFFETGVVSTIYLDDVLITELRAAADDLVAEGELSASAHATIDSSALRHVDYHHHHIHVRVDGL